MTKTIEKKTYSDLFERIYNGTKTYDMRLADWDCQTGDIIKFVEIATACGGVPLWRERM